jgi:transcriptional regulator with XRE-family HTH domain
MPRPNQPRSIASEANVAERITLEREKRDLSYDALAKAMTDEGCSLAATAIYRIEKGQPRRRITVDELVAFARVFDTTEADLLAPMELIRNARAQELARKALQVWEELPAAVYRLTEVVAEMRQLQDSDAEVYESFQHQWRNEEAKLPDPPFAPVVIKRLTALVEAVITVHSAPGGHPAKMPIRRKRDGKVRGDGER